MIQIPENAQITEWPTSTTWFDNSGILCSVYKKGVIRTMADTQKAMEEFKKILNGRKICMLVDVTHTGQVSKEVREYVAMELPKIVKAIAMVSDSPLGKMLANLFLTLKTQAYPTKVFSNELEAREWLKQYL